MMTHPHPGQAARIHYRKDVAPHMPHHGKAVTIRAAGHGRPRNHSVNLPDGTTTVVPAGNLMPVFDPETSATSMHNALTTRIAQLLDLPLDQAPTVALSLRQPWAELIVRRFKDVENRKWKSHRSGWVLIHAAMKCTQSEYLDAMQFASERTNPEHLIAFPDREQLQLGGIVGVMRIAPSDPANTSRWRMEGQFPIPVLGVRRLGFIPCKGMLGYFTPTATPEVLASLNPA